MTIEARLAIQQRVLTPYRAAFFDLLAQSCRRGLAVCAGQPIPGEAVTVTDNLSVARLQVVENMYFGGGAVLFYRQAGLKERLAEWQAEVLITEANPRNLSLAGTSRWMRKRGLPVLGWGLGAPSATGAGVMTLVEKAFLQKHLRLFDGLLTYSQRGAEEYASLGFPAGKIFVAPNAATPRPQKPPPERAMILSGPPTVLFVGRLQSRKKVDRLLEACASLPVEMQPRLVIVGDGPERGRLEALAQRIYPVAEFTGARQGTELDAIFEQADLFVLPGTGGLAVQEAMSHGLPIIMGEGDGTNDDLVRPENGWQVPDVETLPGVMAEALGDIPNLRRMGSASYRRVVEEVNLESMVKAFSQAIQTIQK